MLSLGRGLTQSELEQAKAAGVIIEATPTPSGPGVDRAGFDLGSGGGGYKVNQVAGGKFYEFSFDVSATQTAAEIDVFGAPGKFFNSVVDYAVSPGGFIVSPTKESAVVGIDYKTIFLVPGPGKYKYYVKVDKPGSLGVQYNQR